METKSSDFQVRSDLILASHGNLFFLINNIGEESKGQTRELTKSRGTVLKTMQT